MASLCSATQHQKPTRRDTPMRGDLFVDLQSRRVDLGGKRLERNRQLRVVLLASNLRLQPRAVLVECERVEKSQYNRTAANPPQLSQRAAACFGVVEMMEKANAGYAFELIGVEAFREHVAHFKLHVRSLAALLTLIFVVVVSSMPEHRFRYISARNLVTA